MNLFRGRTEVYKHVRQIEEMFGRADLLANDLRLQADYGRYLCIAVSGLLEKSLQELAMEACRRQCSGPVVNLAHSYLDWSRPPTFETIMGLLQRFSIDWADKFSDFVSLESKEAINSVVGLRNDIAHGGGASVTPGRMHDYYSSIRPVVDFLADLLDPVPA